MIVDADRFVALIKLSQVVDEPLLEQKLADAPADVSSAATNLANYLIDAGVLTRWQADNLLTGKHKGFRLGNYRLKRKLGRGGMSTVYLAEHALMKRQAAIKVLPRRRIEDSSYLARFHREAQAAAALDHPNIVRIYDVDADGNVHYIAMEFINGQDLQTRVSNDGRLDCDLAADYIAQAAQGLQHAHDIGLIHRDVKPANLLANQKGIIKVLDMGLAKFDEDEDATSLTIEHDENVLGTVDYLSPEQAVDSHNVDHRADIYSLGCTFYFLLTANAPFPEGSLAQRLMKHQKAKPTPILERRSDVPSKLVNICNQMMKKDPAKRTQSATIVAEHLGNWLACRGKSVTGDSTTGSTIGLPASVIREMALNLRHEDEDLNADAVTATETETEEVEKDTTISRAQDETRKSVPSLMPDELDLAPTEEGEVHQQSFMDSSESGKAENEVDSVVDLEFLEKELSPIALDDRITTAKLQVGTRLAPKELQGSAGVPLWVWIVAGTGVVAILVILAVAMAFL